MKVVVEFTTEARADLVALLEARVSAEADALQFAAFYLDDIEQQFQKCEGPPPGSRRLARNGVEEWWWRYADGI